MIGWSVPTVESTQVVEITLEVVAVTYARLLQLVQYFLWQVRCVCQQAVDCRRRWKVEQLIWHTSRTTSTSTGPHSVSVPLMPHTVHVVLYELHEAVPQALHLCLTARMKCSTVH